MFVNSNLIYSTSEVNTHRKWIDNRDIYRKVFTSTTAPAANTWTNIFDLPSGTDYVINISGSIASATDYTIYPTTYYVDTSDYAVTLISNKKVQVRIGTNLVQHFGTMRIIVEYVKSS